jgi:hypothetical protein
MTHKGCNNQKCLCQHYKDHQNHNSLPWVVYYLQACEYHWEEKVKAQWIPRRLKSIPMYYPCNELYWYKCKALTDHLSHGLIY